jgi:hypothetical protein
LEGNLTLNITGEEDIRRGINVYFSDMHRFDSNKQRLNHLKARRVGNPRSKIWREIQGYIES